MQPLAASGGRRQAAFACSRPAEVRAVAPRGRPCTHCSERREGEWLHVPVPCRSKQELIFVKEDPLGPPPACAHSGSFTHAGSSAFSLAHCERADATHWVGAARAMQEWFVTRRGRGLYTRTVALPLWARFFLPCTILQSAILIGINVAIGVLAEDCLTWLILALSSLVTLFMCYFAIEAVRTENAYQCAFLLPNPTPAVCCARLKLSFSRLHTRAHAPPQNHRAQARGLLQYDVCLPERVPAAHHGHVGRPASRADERKARRASPHAHLGIAHLHRGLAAVSSALTRQWACPPLSRSAHPEP